MNSKMELEKIKQFLKKNQYYAHINEDENKKELLIEHTELVMKYFNKLIEKNNLKIIIENLIKNIVFNYENKKEAEKLIKKYFNLIPLFHDIGKINPNFQIEKMGNDKFKKEKLSNIGSSHSKIGAYIYIQAFLKETNEKHFLSDEKVINLFILFALSFSILNHHSPTLNYNNEYFEDNFIEELLKFINKELLIETDFEFQKNIKKQFNTKILRDIFDKIKFDYFALFALLKLNYSLLTAADYYATTHFMNNWEKMYGDFGILTDKIKDKIVENVKTTKKYNKELYNKIDNYKLEFPDEKSNINLNKLRQNLAYEVISGIRKNIDKKLFYIEAPTGGGKTNLSILALTEFIKNNKKDITKVFYVFPFTTLITQTFNVLKETLELNNNEIVQIHSKTGFFQKEDENKYGKDRLNIVDYLFVNYPVVLLSHVKFFNILKSNNKSNNYLLYRLANSIVIIDELQSYPPEEWDKIIYFIKKYSNYFNIKFILMSATLPKIGKLLLEDEKKGEDFVYLISEKEKYFNNPNFKKRVEISFSLLEKIKKDKEENFLRNLYKEVLIESKKYKKRNDYVHTIIEFIIKKTADEFYQIAIQRNDEERFFDEIFILSGLILEPRRKEIISKIKNNNYKKKNILLITTQIVEAGMDIDMDLGFKDISIVDSDEQLAGRINRNVNKSNNKLFLFNYDDSSKIYGNDNRFKKLNKSIEYYKDILQKKSFDRLYDDVMQEKRIHNNQLDFRDNLPAYINFIKKLNFEKIDKNFQIIKNDFIDITVFIPVKVPIVIDEKIKNFTNEEIKFLKSKKIINNNDVYVDGEKIFDLYCSIIENKNKNFINNKIELIIMQGIMSKFIISANLYSEKFQNIIKSGNIENKYGFYKIINADDVYDYNTGFKKLEFSDIFIW
ncbi:hypothetical protein XO12_03825 [Marinitoga sp. 1154]|uniref:CRISPR-associated helicase Cas3' n=1 Tax=Marinitoga sp. 1154 TaxID=1643335 RepID=UPI001586EF0F|nr:CRISPR-associated helicase Cas3' [Marinitoga sp. 1154]NUU99260.1 hypothetical protein [Marinitoga sp. 1154]